MHAFPGELGSPEFGQAVRAAVAAQEAGHGLIGQLRAAEPHLLAQRGPEILKAFVYEFGDVILNDAAAADWYAAVKERLGWP